MPTPSTSYPASAVFIGIREVAGSRFESLFAGGRYRDLEKPRSKLLTMFVDEKHLRGSDMESHGGSELL